ncbi:hypothetical protein BDQ17DRAFT_1429790 [Cyathus striatus]|nr:hypothetical protein BDQ17DRAFT_1429790 [Cyathus striatus]
MSIPHSPLYFNWPADTPNAAEDLENWNAYWETLTSHNTKNRQFIESTLNDDVIPIDLLRAQSKNKKFTLNKFQLAFASNISTTLFEHVWMMLSDSERRKHMLEGFVRSAIFEPEAVQDRVFCSDLTLDTLGEDQGLPFIKLLEFYTKSVNVAPKTVSSYLHPEWSDEMEEDRAKDPNSRRAFMWEFIQLDRDLYICNFITRTMESCRGEPRPTPEPVEDMDAMLEQLSSMGDGTAEDLVQRLLSRVCTLCAKPETPKQPLKWCSKCLAKVQRKVLYCSSECQLKDWPNHKPSCGKV